MLAGLMAIALFVRWYTAFCYRMIVHDKSDVLDGLLLTGEVPTRWRRRRLEKLALGTRGCLGRLMKRCLMRSYARRMKGLISFVHGNRRISPAEAKEIARELRETAQDWLKCEDLNELVR
jgi:hypothetical protein